MCISQQSGDTSLTKSVSFAFNQWAWGSNPHGRTKKHDVPKCIVLFCCLYVKKRARVGIRKARPAANPAGKKCRSTAFFSARERAPTGAPKRAMQAAFEKHAARLFFLCRFPFQRVHRAEIGEPFYILLLCKVDIPILS